MLCKGAFAALAFVVVCPQRLPQNACYGWRCSRANPCSPSLPVSLQVTNRYNTYEFNGAKTSACLMPLRRLAGQAAGVCSSREQESCVLQAAAGGPRPALNVGSDNPCMCDAQTSPLSPCLTSHPCHPCRPSPAVILSTNSWVGGRNNFLGACYITVGGLCLLVALFFFLGYDLGELLQWH